MPAAAQRNNCHSMDAVEITRRKRALIVEWMICSVGSWYKPTLSVRRCFFSYGASRPTDQIALEYEWMRNYSTEAKSLLVHSFLGAFFSSALPQSRPAPPPSYPFLWNENVGCHFTPFSKHEKRAAKIEQKSKQHRQHEKTAQKAESTRPTVHIQSYK